MELSPVRIAIVTARNAPAELRVIKTLRKWGVYVNEIFFLGGVEKTKILKAFKPHIFFDDQDLHLDLAASHIPSGKVPYKTGSPLAKKSVASNIPGNAGGAPNASAETKTRLKAHPSPKPRLKPKAKNNKTIR